MAKFNREKVTINYIYGWHVFGDCLTISVEAIYETEDLDDVIKVELGSSKITDEIYKLKAQVIRDVKEKYQNELLKEQLAQPPEDW